MINLLADDHKDQIRAARTNVVLVRYTLIVLAAVLFLLGVLFVSYSILQFTKQQSEDIISSNDIKADVYSETKTKVDALSTKLSESNAILSQEVRYSQVLTKLGQSLPAGVILDSLKLGEQDFNGAPTDLVFFAKTSDDITTVTSSLQATGLFLQVSLKGTDSNEGIASYPVKATFTVQFNRQGGTRG